MKKFFVLKWPLFLSILILVPSLTMAQANYVGWSTSPLTWAMAAPTALATAWWGTLRTSETPARRGGFQPFMLQVALQHQEIHRTVLDDQQSQ